MPSGRWLAFAKSRSLMALISFVCVRGLVLTLGEIDSDFPNYLTATKLVGDGRST